MIILFLLLLSVITPNYSQNKIDQEPEDPCTKWISKVDPSVHYHYEINTLKKTTPEEDSSANKANLKALGRSLAQKSSNDYFPDTTYTDEEVMAAIGCLLKCKGNKSPSGISGVTTIYFSEFYPDASIEVAALYYISYLYKANPTHAIGIALRKDGKFNPPGAVELAYKYYEKWFEKVKEIGLAKARELKLEPLEGSGISWP
jgi:hypothetical protein